MIDILGPGALGIHCALSLPAHCEVRLRHPKAEGSTWTLKRDEGVTRTVDCLALTDPSPIQQLIVTTKAAQVVAAVSSVFPFLTARAEILLLHNGLGPQDAVAEQLSPEQALYVGVSTEGVVRTGAQQISHRSVGLTQVGPWQRSWPKPALFASLAAGSWAMTWLEDPQATQLSVWQKLIINTAINPLTALLDVPNGALASPEHQVLWRPLVYEACAVANQLGLNLMPELECKRVLAVIHSTAENHSSMWQDWAQGRPSEADFILAPLLANRHNLECPALLQLYEQVKSREAAGRQ